MKEISIVHPIEPVFDESSRILILGSFPSVKSRETAFFYGHPQNRFWQVLAAVFGLPLPNTVDEKRRFLKNAQIAVWDVIASCRIVGSADSSISDAVPNDITPILSKAPIERIYTNGLMATKLYKKHIFPTIGIDCISLPSTSPANAAFSLDRLTEAWRVVKR